MLVDKYEYFARSFLEPSKLKLFILNSKYLYLFLRFSNLLPLEGVFSLWPEWEGVSDSIVAGTSLEHRLIAAG